MNDKESKLKESNEPVAILTSIVKKSRASE